MLATKEKHAKQYETCNKKITLQEEKDLFREMKHHKMIKINNNTHPVLNFKKIISKNILQYTPKLNEISEKKKSKQKPLNSK